jgi:catechol 2,3-dioxygenase-like lactoylglutathione lyase family enzyme
MRLNHVTLRVAELDRSIAFYKMLGLTQIVSDDRYARFVCPDGDSTLSLESRDESPRSAPSVISVHFETERLDALVDELQQQGVEFDQEPKDQPYLWREAILRDPDGHRLFLYHAGVNRLDPPWRLR